MPTNPVTITVTGHAERSIAPNRGVVHLNIEFDAATRAEAADAAISSAAALTQLVGSLEKDAARPLRRWSLDQMQHTPTARITRRARSCPWNYRSTATAAVTFRDLDAVASFVDRASAIGASTSRTWSGSSLVQPTRKRSRACGIWPSVTRSPRRRATPGVSAASASRPSRWPTRDAECGTATGLRTADHAAMATSAPVQDTERPGIELTPERLRITADVEARFEAM
ncbi:DUF541 domain-containing protein [Rhodococcus hoagii]|nr:DUF541 domain-containing protein [Prescottella equi]